MSSDVAADPDAADRDAADRDVDDSQDRRIAPVRQATLTVAFHDPEGVRTRAFVHAVLTQWRVDPFTAAAAETMATSLVRSAEPQPSRALELTVRLSEDGETVDVSAD